MTGSLWGTILPSKDSRKLSEDLRKSLTEEMLAADADECLQLLYRVRDELDRELALSRRIPEEIVTMVAALPEIRDVDELKPMSDRFSRLITELFTARPSVSTACTLALSFHEKIILTAFNHAVTLLEEEGKKAPATPWAVLVSGELGRQESILGKRSSFFFVYRDTREVKREYFDELALRFMAILLICFPTLSRNMNNRSAFWYGTQAEWSENAAAALRGEERDSSGKPGWMTFPKMIETLADLRTVGGEPEFGRAVIEAGREQLAASIHSESFWRLAKEIAVLPVAFGIFGRIKTVRTGKNRGKFNLKEFALEPLSAAVRILALHGGCTETSFSGRMKSIIAAGNIGVALADRLLIAYEDFMREMIRLELRGEQENGGLFFDPDQLDDESKERFKAGLEDVTTLQRLVHQQLVEVEQA